MPDKPPFASPEELREMMLKAKNESPDVPEVIARLGAIRDETENDQIHELAVCMAGLCFVIIGLEGEIEELETKLEH